MQLTIIYYDEPGVEEFEVAKVLAPGDVLAYWTVWYPETDTGQVKVRFIPEKRVKELQMFGEAAEEPQKLATVTSLSDYKGGE